MLSRIVKWLMDKGMTLSRSLIAKVRKWWESIPSAIKKKMRDQLRYAIRSFLLFLVNWFFNGFM